MCSNSVQQTFIEFALYNFDANVKKIIFSANNNGMHFCPKNNTEDLWEEKIAECKLIRQQRMRYPFLGTSIKKELLFIKHFQYQKILKVYILILNYPD